MEFVNIVVKKELEDEYESFSNNNIKCEEIYIKEERVDNEIVQTDDILDETHKKKDLLTHNRNEHAPIKPQTKLYKCDSCKFESEKEELLKKHNNVVHLKIGQFECNLCDFKTGSEIYLKSHLQYVHKIVDCKCRFCGYTATCLRSLNLHEKYNHKDIKTINSNTKRFECTLCNYQTSTRKDINTHMINEHKPIYKLYRCDLCKFKTDIEEMLQEHKDKVHIPEPTGHLECNLCSFKTNSEIELTNHRNDHLNSIDNFYKCDYCCFGSISKPRLTYHIRIKHPNIKKMKSVSYCDGTNKKN